ncbi:hypothetical protein M7I_2615 [Glarea lozoyensis 74030]|uniref:Uncharacterized protein n=1 Tax=Glarea lozoyensis (strain ATCC 74030 / MF5533) TaxID=1104152 RepID=H0EJ77_GLAL7|nr:hypothetical protein M7I_2615 [Glarea lozoyensis 74030]
MGGSASIPTDPSRTLKVIGAGYPRIGTLSMAIALEKLLDGPVMHGGSQLLGREDAYVKLWTKQCWSSLVLFIYDAGNGSMVDQNTLTVKLHS